MKIAIVVSEFPVISQTFIVTQIIGLIQKGHEVTIITDKLAKLPHHKLVEEYKLLNRVIITETRRNSYQLLWPLLKIIISSPTKGCRYIKYFYSVIKKRVPFGCNIFSIQRIFEEYEFDLIHIHFANAALSISNLMDFGILDKNDIVCSFHGYDMHPATSPYYFYQPLYRQIGAFTINSDFSREMALTIGAPLNKLNKMPCGCLVDVFQNKNKQFNRSNKLNLIFVGRLIELKGCDLLLKICYQLTLHKIDFNCKIIGTGDLLDVCKGLILRYNLSSKVALLGSQTQSQIIEWYRLSDLFVFPGRYDKMGRAETQGVVVQEASAMELPILCSDAGGTHEGVIDGITGFVLPAEDIDAFVEKIIYFNQNRSELERMGKAGRIFVEKNYSNEQIIARLEDIYQNTIRKG